METPSTDTSAIYDPVFAETTKVWSEPAVTVTVPVGEMVPFPVVAVEIVCDAGGGGEGCAGGGVLIFDCIFDVGWFLLFSNSYYVLILFVKIYFNANIHQFDLRMGIQIYILKIKRSNG